MDLFKVKSFKLWTVLLLAANKQDFAYYCPGLRTPFAEGLLHLQAMLLGWAMAAEGVLCKLWSDPLTKN